MRLKILVTMLVFLSFGCAKAPLGGRGDSWEMYRSPAAALNTFSGASVAILPSVTAKSEQIYREALSGLLYNSLLKLKNGPRILPPDIVQSAINKSALLDDYQKFLKDYEETAVLRKDILSKLGRSLSVRYVLLPKLLRFQQVTFDRITVFGISFLKTRESSVDIHAQLWDTETGEVIWQGAGEGVLATEVVQGRPVSFMQVAQYACDSLAARLPWVAKEN